MQLIILHNGGGGSWDEFTDKRQRYRIIDRQMLLNRLDFSGWCEFCQWYNLTLEEILENNYFMEQKRYLSSSAAVGSPEWLKDTADHIGMKRYNIIESDQNDGFNFKSFSLGRDN